MFNDRYGLTYAVLSGRKTMTRRIINFKNEFVLEWTTVPSLEERWKKDILQTYTRYKVGDIVAVAQPYSDIWDEMLDNFNNSVYDKFKEEDIDNIINSKGWGNKMFVRADLMPHRIRITNIKVEHLQDIDDEQATREGIQTDTRHFSIYQGQHGFYNRATNRPCTYQSPRLAFAHLIDKVSRKGTWDLNPWVFVYEFEIIK